VSPKTARNIGASKSPPVAKIKNLKAIQSQNDSEIKAKGRTLPRAKRQRNQTNCLRETKPKPNGDKIEAYARHALRVFNMIWDVSKDWISTLPVKDAEEMSVERYYDLRMRVAQHIAIEVAKIIRKERF
jgi:hypothetical protein